MDGIRFGQNVESSLLLHVDERQGSDSNGTRTDVGKAHASFFQSRAVDGLRRSFFASDETRMGRY